MSPPPARRSSSPALIVMRKPGVQNPHCRAWHSRKASCTGCSICPPCPSSVASPPTLCSWCPSAWPASIRHERIGRPSTSTVHAPHTPCSQPTCVPVSPRSWRSTSDSSRRAGTRTSRVAPLTERRTSWSCSLMRGPLGIVVWSSGAGGARDPVGCSSSAFRVVVRRSNHPGGEDPHELGAVGRGGRGVVGGLQLLERGLAQLLQRDAGQVDDGGHVADRE